MYQSPTLSDGQHTLAVGAPDTVPGDASTQFYFDYLTYVPSASSGTTPNPVVSTAKSGNHRKAVVLSAVLVPCLLLIAALGAVLYLHRKRRRAVLTVTPLVLDAGPLTENSASRFLLRIWTY